MNYEDFSAQQNEKLTALLSAIDAESFDKDTVKTDLTHLLKSQDEYGKASYTKKASQVNKYLEMLGKLGYDKDSYDNADDFITKLKEKVDKVPTDTDALQVLQARLEKLETEKSAETARAESLKATADKNTIENKLKDALGDKLKGAKFIIKDLIAEKQVKLVDGEVVFVSGDDSVILFEEGIQNILNDNEDLLKVDIKSGAGSTSKSFKDTSTGSLSMEAINKMTPEQIKAHMAQIKKLAGIR
jgi:hypothetical protein